MLLPNNKDEDDNTNDDDNNSATTRQPQPENCVLLFAQRIIKHINYTVWVKCQVCSCSSTLYMQ